VLWSRQVEDGVKAFKVVLSSSGSYLAAAIANSAFQNEQHSSFIIVCNGTTGRDVASLPKSGTNGIALSPDGDLIAAVSQERGEKGAAVPTVRIYDVMSGKELASVAHEEVRKGPHQFLEAGCTAEFTSDGKYLVTSGAATRIWKIE
jgi:WD40 repeat protein